MNPKETQGLIKKNLELYIKLFGFSEIPLDVNYVGYDEIEGNYAEVEVSEDMPTIHLNFNIEKLSKEPKEIEKSVIHELLHVVYWPIRQQLLKVCKNLISDGKVQDLIKDHYRAAEHKIIYMMEEIFVQDKKKLGHKSSRKNKRIKKDLLSGKRKKQNKEDH